MHLTEFNQQVCFIGIETLVSIKFLPVEPQPPVLQTPPEQNMLAKMLQTWPEVFNYVNYVQFRRHMNPSVQGSSGKVNRVNRHILKR